jgi:predicted RNA-binding Zn-ribbon protein involved in translation (DUF1610 family)
METNKQFCPICKAEVTPYPRYPQYVCNDCGDKATDKDGRKVIFGNTDMMGYGCEGIYVDTQEEYPSNTCYIDGHECIAAEARFGGIVIEMK